MLIIDKNIVGESIEMLEGGFEFDEDNLTTSGNKDLLVDGEPHKVSYVIEHNDDYKTAEVIEFYVDGENIDL